MPVLTVPLPSVSPAAPIAAGFKRALRMLARPVAVITASVDDVPYAMSATAFCEVSMDPPSMLVCINRHNATYAAVAGGCDIGVNLLSAGQADLCRRCGDSGDRDAKFAMGEWTLAPGRPPLLAASCAALIVRPAKVVDHATHAIVIGEVVEVVVNEGRAPLTFYDGAYRPPLV